MALSGAERTRFYRARLAANLEKKIAAGKSRVSWHERKKSGKVKLIN